MSPLAGMLPDYQMIAEVDLYTRGVVDAKIAARKLVTCMRMMSELLSSQDHYDFGMRAIKSLAAATAQKKREQPQMRRWHGLWSWRKLHKELRTQRLGLPWLLRRRLSLRPLTTTMFALGLMSSVA